MVAVLGHHWPELRQQSKGTFAVLSVLCLWRLTKEQTFQKESKEMQNILKWVAILHGLKKQGLPTIHGRDHVHPFKSANTLIELFIKLGIIDLNESDGSHTNWSHVQRMLMESTQPLPSLVREDFQHGKPVCTVMHSHHNLEHIFFLLWRNGKSKLAIRGDFIDLCLRAVMFHQSIQQLEEYQ